MNDNNNSPDTIRIILDDTIPVREKPEETVKTFTVERTPSSRKKKKVKKEKKEPKKQYPQHTASKYGKYSSTVLSTEILDIIAENAKREKQNTEKSFLKKLLIVLLVILLLFGAMAGFVLFKMFGMNFVRNEPQVGKSGEDFVTDEYDREYASENAFDELSPDEVELELADPIGDDKLINILLVGQDRRPGEVRARSDAMILCSINPETGKASLISFLRDLYVSIPGYSDNRMNAAYAFGGFKLLKETLKANFGISVDGCFEADFDDFAALIDLIGGTDINLTEAEAGIIGGVSAGMCHLNGAQTLKYARIRKIGSDFGRTERQRNVLLVCLEKIRRLGTTQLLGLVNTALPYLSTDMSTIEITSLLTKLTPLLPKASVGTYFIPASGHYYDAMIKGMAVLVPDLAKNRTILAEEYLPF